MTGSLAPGSTPVGRQTLTYRQSSDGVVWNGSMSPVSCMQSWPNAVALRTPAQGATRLRCAPAQLANRRCGIGNAFEGDHVTFGAAFEPAGFNLRDPLVPGCAARRFIGHFCRDGLDGTASEPRLTVGRQRKNYTRCSIL